MSRESKIEWTDATFNPWIGCTKVSPGCANCYAEAWALRFAGPRRAPHWGDRRPRRRTTAAYWRQPLRWNAKRFMQCHACGWRGECAAELIGCGACGSSTEMNDARRRVFCASLADVFDNEVPPEWRADLFRLIEATPHLDWLLLTKRIGNAQRLIEQALISMGDPATDVMGGWPWPNVWLGATVVNQEEADRDIPKLLDTPAAVRFVSVEPMLGPVDLQRFMWPVLPSWPARFRSPEAALAAGAEVSYHRQALLSVESAKRLVAWVICGGESGPHARPMHPVWARLLRDQCAAAGVPFLFKQWGEWLEHGHGQPDRTYEIGDEEADRLASECDGFLGRDGTFLHDIEDADDEQPYRGLRRVGRKAAGRLLDGREWNGYPVGVAL